MAPTDATRPAQDPRPVVVEARSVQVAFPRKKVGQSEDLLVVKDFSLKIRQGEIVGLLGESGSGKSVAALALLGLVQPPGRIVQGEVIFEGKDLLKKPREELRHIRGRDISLILQSPHAALNPLMDVGDQMVNAYRAHHNVPKSKALEHSIDMLRLVGINDPGRRIRAFPHELSGGMAQRVVIAMALSSNPTLLVADEPSSGLDVTVQAQILDDMWVSVQHTGSAILLISKDLGVIANYCDRVAVLHEGTIVEDRPALDFFRSPDHTYSQMVLSLQRGERLVASGMAGTSPQGSISASARSEPIVEIEHLTKCFDIQGSKDKIQAVYDVSLRLPLGETLGLVGESGSGKTTTGRCILRLESPSGGEIRYRGTPIASIPLNSFRRYRSKMQIVFQNPFESLNPRWTVGQTLQEPLDLHTDLTPAEKKARVHGLMHLVGLAPDLIAHRPRELSAGMRQRVAIARALATNPEFIVLDEPTSALPPDAQNEIIELLIGLQERLGLSYLFISHNLGTVKYLCHRVGIMYLSQIVEIGAKEQVFNNPLHPYSQGLMASVVYPDPTNRRIDLPREQREQLKGEIPSPINLPLGCYLYSRCRFAVETCRETPQRLEPAPDGRLVRCWRVSQEDHHVTPHVAQREFGMNAR